MVLKIIDFLLPLATYVLQLLIAKGSFSKELKQSFVDFLARLQSEPSSSAKLKVSYENQADRLKKSFEERA